MVCRATQRCITDPTCRNMKKAAAVMDRIKKRIPYANLSVPAVLDFANLDTVRSFAEVMNARQTPIDILINNAGQSYMKRSYNTEGVGMMAQVGDAASSFSLAGHTVTPCPKKHIYA